MDVQNADIEFVNFTIDETQKVLADINDINKKIDLSLRKELLVQQLPEQQIENDHSDIDEIELEVEVENEPPAERAKYSKVQDLDLKQVLNDHPLGPSIKIIHDCKRGLCSFSQSYLCNIISTYLLRTYGL